MILILKSIYESIVQAFQQLRGNLLRTFLSLLGITIGIFCIIAVQSAVDSIQNSIKSGFGELGSDVIMVDVMPWDEDPGMNYWKYMRRPSPSYQDYEELKERLNVDAEVCYGLYVGGKTIKYKSSSVEGALTLGTTYEFPDVQVMDIAQGRYFTRNEYENGDTKVILGNKISTELFGLEDPLGKNVKMFGQKFQVIGVLKEEGDNPFNFISYDEATWINYNTAKRFINTKNQSRFSAAKILYAKALNETTTEELKDEITGKLRAIRKLKPKEEDNFSLNEIAMLNKMIDNVFGVINIAGLFIGIFALIVGMISVANIMFVSVKERTNIIGIKKALGAKRYMILLEFLMEAIILCIIGGVFGLLFVFTVMKIISALIPLELWLSPRNSILGLSISVIVGILSGVIPAIIASKLDPVVAIRQG